METFDREPDGYIRWTDPRTGVIELMAVWLPAGETAESLGLSTYTPNEDA